MKKQNRIVNWFSRKLGFDSEPEPREQSRFRIAFRNFHATFESRIASGLKYLFVGAALILVVAAFFALVYSVQLADAGVIYDGGFFGIFVDSIATILNISFITG